MSEWVNYVKTYAETHNVPYKQALKDASLSYKARNEKKIEAPKQELTQEPETKTKKKTNKKLVEKISVKL